MKNLVSFHCPILRISEILTTMILTARANVINARETKLKMEVDENISLEEFAGAFVWYNRCASI